MDEDDSGERVSCRVRFIKCPFEERSIPHICFSKGQDDAVLNSIKSLF